ncbi:MAG: PAS domain-containing protein, partial [Spirochaetota bacterium]
MEPYKDLYTVLTRSVRFLNRQFESTAVFFSSFSSFLVGQACCTAAVFCEISNTSVSLAGEMHLPAGLHRLLAGKEVDDYPYTDVFTGGEIVRLETEESPHGACIVPVKNRYFVYAAFVVLPDGTLPPESVLDLFATLSVLVAGVLEKLQQSFDNPHFVMTRTHFRQDILDSILDALPDPFFVKDTSGRYVRCNKAFREFVGKSSEELIGNRLADFTTDPNLAIIDTGKGGTV